MKSDYSNTSAPPSPPPKKKQGEVGIDLPLFISVSFPLAALIKFSRHWKVQSNKLLMPSQPRRSYHGKESPEEKVIDNFLVCSFVLHIPLSSYGRLGVVLESPLSVVCPFCHSNNRIFEPPPSFYLGSWLEVYYEKKNQSIFWTLRPLPPDWRLTRWSVTWKVLVCLLKMKAMLTD